MVVDFLTADLQYTCLIQALFDSWTSTMPKQTLLTFWKKEPKSDDPQSGGHVKSDRPETAEIFPGRADDSGPDNQCDNSPPAPPAQIAAGLLCGDTATPGHAGGSADVSSGSGKKYSFQTVWKDGNDWLVYDSVNKSMFCSYCQTFDKSGKKNAFREGGCKSLRWSNIKAHKVSEVHMKASAAKKVSTLERKDRPMEKQILQLGDGEVERMKKYFRTGFYIAQAGKPYSDFKDLMELQVANFGNQYKSGYETYLNDKACHEFIKCIAEDLLERNASHIKEDSFISILADGSTDKSNTEQEIIYVTMLKAGRPVTQFITLYSVPNADAEHLTEALKETMTEKLKLRDWTQNVICCCFDGASVNLGALSGVATRLAKEAPHIIPVHCCAHRLELAIKDVNKEVSAVPAMESTLQSVYRLYKRSRTKWNALQATGKTLEIQVRRPVKLVGTRWLAHHLRALTSFSHNWPAVIVHLEDLSQTGDSTDRFTATELLKTLKSLELIYFMNFMLTYLAIMAELSLVLQRNTTTVDVVIEKTCAVKQQLQNVLAPTELNAILINGLDDPENPTKFRSLELVSSCVLQ